MKGWLLTGGALIAGILTAHLAVARASGGRVPTAALGRKLSWPLLIPGAAYAILFFLNLPNFISWLSARSAPWTIVTPTVSSVLLTPMFVALCAWLGWRDDQHGIKGRVKLLTFIAIWLIILSCSLIGTFGANAIFSQAGALMGDPGVQLRYAAWTAVVAASIGLGVTIAMPLIDGLNGLFLGVIAAGFIHLKLCLAYQAGSVPLELSISGGVTTFTIGLLLGLGWHNVRTGRIRLGEAVVLPLAFLTGYWTWAATCNLPPSYFWPLLSSDRPPLRELLLKLSLSAVIVTLPFIYPLLDSAMILLKRRAVGRSVFSGGCDHLHHRLNQLGLSSGHAAGALVSAALLPSLAMMAALLLRADGWKQRAPWIEWGSPEHPQYPGIDLYDTRILLWGIIGLLPLAYLFWRGYTKVDPYQSGAVDERGRP